MYRLHARVAGKGWGFGGWDYWDTGTDFVTHYTGRVVANLADPEGKHCDASFSSCTLGMSRRPWHLSSSRCRTFRLRETLLQSRRIRLLYRVEIEHFCASVAPLTRRCSKQ